MKESVGSTLLLYVFMVLFVIIVSFMAVTINFALTFQKKNEIINILERSEGKSSVYTPELNKLFNNNSRGWKIVTSINNNYDGYKCKILEKSVNNENNRGKYYQIVVFVEFNLPVVNEVVYFPINGETSTITTENTESVGVPTIRYN